MNKVEPLELMELQRNAKALTLLQSLYSWNH
jgi:hypothetical protein